jgi:ATP-dependent Clp protease protease subunit
MEDAFPEIPIVGDLTEHENDVTDKLLSVPPGGACLLYFNCPGGSAYCALSLMSLILGRGLNATGVVTGECSSAALWPFAACKRRIVTPHSVLLFHPMKWESGEHVEIAEAAEWARHFVHLEHDLDSILSRSFGASQDKIASWLRPGRYVLGTELAEAGLAELVSLDELGSVLAEVVSPRPRKKRKG